MRTRAFGGILGLSLLGGCPNTPVSFGASSDEVGESTDTGNEEVAVADHRTFFIGESRKYDGGGACENRDLNTVTKTLRNALVDAGWTGLRFVDQDSWPEDYRDASESSPALDDLYGDASRLSVYAGHGNPLELQWGRPSGNGACSTWIPDMVRLGRFDGDTAAATMLLTSCALRTDQIWATYKENAFRQIYGYHDSPHIGHDEPRKVFERSRDGQPTAHAWLDEMEHNVHGKNSPVVMTFGHVAGEAEAMHAETNLATGAGFIVNVQEPVVDFYFEWLDNGCFSRCGGCTGGAAIPPEIDVATAPKLRLTRPLRSSADLVERVESVLAMFESGALSSEDTMRLETWAADIVDHDDIGFARVGGFELTYDPSADLLRVRDREALDRARPKWTEMPPESDAALVESLRSDADGIRVAMESVPGLLDQLGQNFESSARKVGFGGEDRPTREISYEYLFTLAGRFADFEVVGSHLQIGMTRFGELGSVTIAGMGVEVVGRSSIERGVTTALEALRDELEVEHPSATAIEFVDPRVGYALREDQKQAEVDVSVIVGVMLAFPAEGPLDLVSRRWFVRMSLVSADASSESLEAVDLEAENGGDPRAAN